MSNYRFTCPHCGQNLEAPENTRGQTVACPTCKGSIAIPTQAAEDLAALSAPPPPPPPPAPDISGAEQIPHACPLCGKEQHMKAPRVLYGHFICRKCYYDFANRRQLAYFLDMLGYYAICFVAGMAVGTVMGAMGASAKEIEGMGSLLAWMILPILFCKDCFAGQSVGKAICGVKVIDKTTGLPGGIGASFKRNLPLVIPFMPLVVGVQLCKGSRIGDGWANTMVVWKKYADHPIFAPAQAPADA